MSNSSITKSQIADLVKAGVHEVLPHAKISRVKVEEDLDSSGERPILAIMVIFSKLPPLKGENFFSLHEAVENRLASVGEMRYPLLRYVEEKELRGAVS
jgi:hypothetical protein